VQALQDTAAAKDRRLLRFLLLRLGAMPADPGAAQLLPTDHLKSPNNLYSEACAQPGG
jgi:hypothetical protein